MTRDEARQEILSRWEEIIPELTSPAKKKGQWVCPFPNCGHGKNGDGLTINPKSRVYGLKCFGPCGFSGNIIDLYMKLKETDYLTAFNELSDMLGLTVDRYTSNEARTPMNTGARATSNSRTEKVPAETKQVQKPTDNVGLQDYNDYYIQCLRRMNDPEAVAYMKSRGISEQTAALYCVGYDPAWISPTVIRKKESEGSDWRPPATKRIILPVSANHYIARAIDPAAKIQKQNETGGGDAEIFNLIALYGTGSVFVTEGYFDALSILEVGGSAIALNSTSNAQKLLSLLEEDRNQIKATLILCLDNDDPGKNATDLLKTGLDRLNISYITADIFCGQKDPNAALVAYREVFEAAVRKAQRETSAKPDSTATYIDTLMFPEIEQFKKASERKTGFEKLDVKTGGIFPGLYTLAATSSLGKTTFCLQLADQLAASGNHVLFFSMEQSRLELVSKSLARITAQENRDTAINSLAIRNGRYPDRVRRAAQKYKALVGDRVNIIEGNFGCTIDFIGDYVRRYIGKNGATPVVFIDYLQILQPSEEQKRQSTKEVMDTAVTELKRLSRELDLTIFVISSVNRANYMLPIDFESLKESGSIEYSSDVVLGLQLQCLNEPLFSEANKLKEKRQRIRVEKAANPRKIELLCLKNRYGVSNFSCGFNYYPDCDLYEEPAASDFNPYYGENPFADTKPTGNGTQIAATF